MKDFYYRKLDCYQLAKELTIQTYALLKQFPKEEQYALCDQIRRAAISIPSNIAEGVGRMSIKERIHFLEVSYASLTELLCQLEISLALSYISDTDFKQIEDMATRTAMTISGLRKSLDDKLQNKQ